MKSSKVVKESEAKAQEEVAATESVLDKAVKAVEKKATKKATKKTDKIDSIENNDSTKSEKEKDSSKSDKEKASKKQEKEKASKKQEKEKASLKSEKDAAKKSSSKKAFDTKVVFQFFGNEIETKALLEQARADFIAAGGKEKEIKAMELYIKPEENVAYYVVNGVPSGKIAIFS